MTPATSDRSAGTGAGRRDDPLLDASSVGDYLIGRGVLTEAPTTATALPGGVSNVVLLVEAGTTRVVVKQALERLRVADDWRVDRSRIRNEASALRILNRLTPEAVPALLDEDPDRFAVTISAAPPGWATWKQRLMSGSVDTGVARWLGELLIRWHTGTRGIELPSELEHTGAFRQLRIAPYLHVSAARRPDLAPQLTEQAARLLTHRPCLTLGDFSPKNVLIGEAAAGWVIDHEVAHRGDPAFDVGFMLSHLLLKSVHLPPQVARLRRCIDVFLRAYGGGAGVEDREHLWAVVGSLLLARVVGSSPAEYLLPDEAARVETAAARILRTRPLTLQEVWDMVVEP